MYNLQYTCTTNPRVAVVIVCTKCNEMWKKMMDHYSAALQRPGSWIWALWVMNLGPLSLHLGILCQATKYMTIHQSSCFDEFESPTIFHYYIKTYVSYSFQIYTTVIYIVNYILATFYLKMEPCVWFKVWFGLYLKPCSCLWYHKYDKSGCLSRNPLDLW